MFLSHAYGHNSIIDKFMCQNLSLKPFEQIRLWDHDRYAMLCYDTHVGS